MVYNVGYSKIWRYSSGDSDMKEMVDINFYMT